MKFTPLLVINSSTGGDVVMSLEFITETSLMCISKWSFFFFYFWHISLFYLGSLAGTAASLYNLSLKLWLIFQRIFSFYMKLITMYLNL